VALAAFLICFAAIASVSIAQMQRSQVADTYEAVFTGIDESDVTALKEQPELARVGEYYQSIPREGTTRPMCTATGT